VEFESRDLLASPPTREEWARWASLLPEGARSLLNPNKVSDPDYVREIQGKELTDGQLVDVFARFPDLARKPVVDGGSWVVAGYEPETLERYLASG
jgi:arsenate reductase-like glutaredoxin family protein